MSTERTTRVTALSALVLAAMALGVGLVNLGCERKSDVTAEQARAAQGATDDNKEGARMPSSPLAKGAAPATVPTVQKIIDKSSEVPPSAAKPAGAARAKTATSGMKDGLIVKRLVLTNAIENREPARVSGFQTGAGPIVAFIEAQNPMDDAQKIVVTFEHASGKKVGFVKLEIPQNSSRWRTWARSSHVTAAGEWNAVVRNGDGEELARQSFDVQG